MLGYNPARRVVELGRPAFFPTDAPDLPRHRSATVSLDDQVPQFGFVGDKYSTKHVLFLGINPGNGDSTVPSAADARMMPAHRRFFENSTESNYIEMTRAYFAECQNWSIWKRHCSEVIGAGKLSMREIAYSNCLPWRTGSQSGFADSVARKTAENYVGPMLRELNPSVIIALGKAQVPLILQMTHVATPTVIIWNRSQAPTLSARQDRAMAAREIQQVLTST